VRVFPGAKAATLVLLAVLFLILFLAGLVRADLG